MVERHEILRTRFAVADGEPVQIVEPPSPMAVGVLDLSDAPDAEERVRTLVEAEGRRTFDLACLPLLVMTLVKTAEERHWLVRASHHIISDAASWTVFMRDLAAAYAALANGQRPALPPLPVQYADYAIWQRRLWARGSARQHAAVDWWQAQVEGLPPTRHLPYRRTRPAGDVTVADGSLRWGLDPDTSGRLDRLGAGEGATYFATRVAALSPVVAALAGTDTVVIGAVFGARPHASLERTFGLFANPALLIVPFDGDLAFRVFVRRVAKILADVQARADIPIRHLAAEMKARHVRLPAAQLVVNVVTPHPPLSAAGIALSWDVEAPRVREGIFLRFNQFRESDGCDLTFDARIWDTAGMIDFRDRVVRFAGEAARNPDARLTTVLSAAGIASAAHRDGNGLPADPVSMVAPAVE